VTDEVERPAPAAAASPSAAPKKTRPRWVQWALDLALIVAIFAGIQWWRARDLVASGEAPPALVLNDLDGNVVDLATLEPPVLVHFWATWCTVCDREVGALNAVADAASGRVVTVVEDGDDRARVAAHVADRGIRYPVLLADEATVAAWRVSVYPTNYYVGGDGNIALVDTGMSSRLGFRVRLWLAGLRG